MNEFDRFESIAVAARDVESALRHLHGVGASPIGAIRAVASGRGMTLLEAKAALSASPAWSAETKDAEALHDQILDALAEGGDDVDV